MLLLFLAVKIYFDPNTALILMLGKLKMWVWGSSEARVQSSTGSVILNSKFYPSEPALGL